MTNRKGLAFTVIQNLCWPGKWHLHASCITVSTTFHSKNMSYYYTKLLPFGISSNFLASCNARVYQG